MEGQGKMEMASTAYKSRHNKKRNGQVKRKSIKSKGRETERRNMAPGKQRRNEAIEAVHRTSVYKEAGVDSIV